MCVFQHKTRRKRADNPQDPLFRNSMARDYRRTCLSVVSYPSEVRLPSPHNSVGLVLASQLECRRACETCCMLLPRCCHSVRVCPLPKTVSLDLIIGYRTIFCSVNRVSDAQKTYPIRKPSPPASLSSLRRGELSDASMSGRDHQLVRHPGRGHRHASSGWVKTGGTSIRHRMFWDEGRRHDVSW